MISRYRWLSLDNGTDEKLCREETVLSENNDPVRGAIVAHIRTEPKSRVLGSSLNRSRVPVRFWIRDRRRRRRVELHFVWRKKHLCRRMKKPNCVSVRKAASPSTSKERSVRSPHLPLRILALSPSHSLSLSLFLLPRVLFSLSPLGDRSFSLSLPFALSVTLSALAS